MRSRYLGTHVVMDIKIWFVLLCRLQDPAGAHIAAAVVGLGVLALGDTAAACRVDEVEGVVVVDTGNDANMADASASRTALEEHQVTRLQVILLDAHTITDLTPRRAVQIDAEALEHIAGKARAVKTTGRHGAVAIRSATEAVCVIDNLVNDAVAAVLLQLFQNSALLAIAQLLGLCSEA